MRYDILMKVKLVEGVFEKRNKKNTCVELIITMSCETPVNEMDTVTIISCNLGGEFFDTECSKLDDSYQVQGTFKICDPDIFGKFNVGDMIIPLPDMFLVELRSGTYESEGYSIEKACKHLTMGMPD